jgi:tRNA(Arg) A34 adenosine deaminase TadA
MHSHELRIALPAWFDAAIDTTRIYAGGEARVGLAIALARRNVEERTGGPFGAAVFDGEGRVVGAGVNVVLAQTSSIAHAEIMAMTMAQKRVRRARLNEDGKRYVLATSAQPCAMCYGASIWAGIDGILIAARTSDVMAQSDFDEGPLPADWIGELERRGIAVTRDVLREEAREVFALYARMGGPMY